MPLRSDWSGQSCPIARSLEVVGDPWVMLIMRQALSGVRRYDDFRAELGIADNVLSRRLQELVDAELLRRAPYPDGNRTRYEYLLTPAGADLLPAINALAIWGEKHRPHADQGVRMDIVHVACGQLSASADWCGNCGTPMTATDVAWRKSWRSPADLRLVGAGQDSANARSEVIQGTEPAS